MYFGVAFPQQFIGTDPQVIRAFGQGAEEAGFDFLSIVDHVAGADRARFDRNIADFANPPYLYDNPIHEPLSLFSYFAACTSRIELVTSVIVLPQRETVLVAKQAAEVAILSSGRLRLGVGIGWNYVEYEALGADFHTRGEREAEQIAVLRKLWTEPLVTFEGRWHHLDRVGINPLPNSLIPIWMGGRFADSTMRRIAQLADGWIPLIRADDNPSEIIARMSGYLAEEGRDPSTFGLQVSISPVGEPADWIAIAKQWTALGASHIGLMANMRGSGLTAMEGLEKATEIKRVLELEFGI